MKLLSFLINIALIIVCVIIGCLGYDLLKSSGRLRRLDRAAIKAEEAGKRLRNAQESLTTEAYTKLETRPNALQELSDDDVLAEYAKLKQEYEARKKAKKAAAAE